MSEPSPFIYLVAGATRGIGLALVDEIASKDPTAIIYAGARDPQGASQLVEVAAKYPGRIEIVKYVAGDKDGNEALAKEMGKKHKRVDTVIANAGISNYVGRVDETPVEKLEDHFLVNALGPVVLFQSVRELLKNSPLPRFVPISSMVGSLASIRPAPRDASPYGVSKAALNWITRKIHFENEWLIAFPQCPGPVYTDMAKAIIAADTTGAFGEQMKNLWRTPSVAAGMLLDIIMKSTREADGGRFHNIQGGRHPW